jgi:hypothetical protein
MRAGRPRAGSPGRACRPSAAISTQTRWGARALRRCRRRSTRSPPRMASNRMPWGAVLAEGRSLLDAAHEVHQHAAGAQGLAHLRAHVALAGDHQPVAAGQGREAWDSAKAEDRWSGSSSPTPKAVSGLRVWGSRSRAGWRPAGPGAPAAGVVRGPSARSGSRPGAGRWTPAPPGAGGGWR